LLEKALAAKNGDKLRRLMDGDTSEYGGDDSAADLALCSMLAFWADDTAQIDRIFRRSGLMRAKWDEKHGAGTYGERTIEKALAGRTEHYHGEHHLGDRANGDGSNEKNNGGDPGPYTVNGGRICKIRYDDKGNATYEPLCNFDAKVSEEILLDDGAEATRAFIIEGKLAAGKLLPSCRIPASRFASMSWVTEQWGLRAVVNAGTTKRDALREAIQRLSPDPRLRHIFTHTGWREIDGKWVYLSGNTAGAGDFEVDLGSELSRYKLPPLASDPAGAMKTSLELLSLAPLRITAPLLAACFRAPLVSAFPQDLSIWIAGPTGSMKSTIAAVFQSHFGDFDRIHLPGAWSSTANQLERRAFLLKDSLFVIDDYAPAALDHRELETKAARLLRSQGNLAGRGRLRSDLTERPAFPPRGIILSTGEQHPAGQSLLARTLIIELDRMDIDVQSLTRAQERADHLAHAMAGYIAWLAPQMSDMPQQLRQTFQGARTKATVGGEHLRIPEAAAHLWLGLHCGLVYAEEIGALSTGQAAELGEKYWEAFIQIARDQAKVVDEEKPVRRFLDVLSTLVTQGRAVLSPKDETPPEPRPGIDFLGWRDDESFYLLPEATFSAVVRFCRDTGEHFPVRQERLKRDLAKEQISKCDAGRLTTTTRVGGHTRRVLQLDIKATGITGHHRSVTTNHHVSDQNHQYHHKKEGQRDGV